MNSSIFLSVISPVYGADSLLPELVKQIHQAASQITDKYEIILIEDSSPDKSWEIIKELSIQDKTIKGIRLSRNFGQQNALNAGFNNASGEWVVTLDCDLQDDPKYILNLFNEAKKGYDIVFASRQNRRDSWSKKILSKLFYKFLGYLTETQQDGTVANFILYNKKVVDAMNLLGDYYLYYPMINKWVGFNTSKLYIPHQLRLDQKDSSYSFKKRFSLAFNTIIAFSDKPLRLLLKLGFSLVMLSTLAALFLIVWYFINETSVRGWLSVFISVWLLSGIIIFTLGLTGTYLGKLFETSKQRPKYIIREKTNAN